MFGAGIFGASLFGGDAPEFSAVLTALSLTAVLNLEVSSAFISIPHHDALVTEVPNTYSSLFTIDSNGATLQIPDNGASVNDSHNYEIALTSIYRL